MTQVNAVKQVELNGVKYNVMEKVVAERLSRFPGKVQFGDNTFDNQTVLSAWITNDHRGGIGIEEMDERVHLDRCWWTNCVTDYLNHLLLPRKATSITPAGNTVTWTSPTGFVDPSAAWTNEANAYDDDTGTAASTTAEIATATWSSYLELSHSAISTDIVRFWVDISVNNSGDKIDIDAYYGAAWNNVYTGKFKPNEWNYKGFSQGTQTITSLRFRIYNGDTIATSTGYIWEVDYGVLSGSHAADIKANFNGNLYIASASWLYRLSSDRAYIYAVGKMAANITALIPALNSELYIFVGDSTNYYHMNTDEVITQSNSANAYWGIQWDSKLFKIKSDGTMAYSTDPDGAAPTWTSHANITDIADQIEQFLIGRNADGNDIIYCATNSVLKALDFANTIWLDTSVKLTGLATGGMGATNWHDGIYIPHGLGMKKYIPGSTATLSEAGLDRDDGLPVEYNGEITTLGADSASNVLFAGVDSSITSGNSKSGLYAYDERGWKCWWIDSANNGAMSGILISTASSSYAVYYSVGAKIYYIDIPRGISNLKQLAGTQEYESSGIYLSPWFDAGSEVWAKLLKSVWSFLKGVTDAGVLNETVTVKYRLDHTNVDLDTGWTTLATYNDAATENGALEAVLASGAGIVFKAIQFRLDLTRGTTTTNSPDLKSGVMAFRKEVSSRKANRWTIRVILDGEYDDSAIEQKAKLDALAALNTDFTFIYKDSTTHYVAVDLFRSFDETGHDANGDIYTLSLIEA